MKLTILNEGDNRPDLEWVPLDPPPVHGDPCPMPGCRGVVQNRWRAMGAPSFRACKFGHAFLIDQKGGYRPRSRPEFEDPEEAGRLLDQLVKIAELQGSSPEVSTRNVWSSLEHSCRFPPASDDLSGVEEGSSDEAKLRQNRRSCEKCAIMYDALLDLEMSFGSATPEEKEDLEDVGFDLKGLGARLASLDPRRGHQPGRFGTGRVKPIQAGDQLPLAVVKMMRDRGVRVDPVTGLGLVQKKRDRCGFGHTCHDHPSGKPAQNYPMPDPMAGEATGKYRYNFMFKEVEPGLDPRGKPDPWVAFQWPVSGLSGFKPKPQYMDYVMSKLECSVCNGSEAGCSNPVAQEYGQAKPFCKEHSGLMPYGRELEARYSPEKLSLKGEDPEAREKYEEWRRTHAESILPGDKVRWKFIPSSLRGKKVKTGDGYTQVYVIATGEAQKFDPKLGWQVKYEWDSDQVPVYVNERRGRVKKRHEVGKWEPSLSGVTWLDAEYLDIYDDMNPQDWDPGDPDAPRKIVRG